MNDTRDRMFATVMGAHRGRPRAEVRAEVAAQRQAQARRRQREKEQAKLRTFPAEHQHITLTLPGLDGVPHNFPVEQFDYSEDTPTVSYRSAGMSPQIQMGGRPVRTANVTIIGTVPPIQRFADNVITLTMAGSPTVSYQGAVTAIKTECTLDGYNRTDLTISLFDDEDGNQ